jgi:beta-glucosidase
VTLGALAVPAVTSAHVARADSPTACPSKVTAFPKNPDTLPWMSASYRAKFTADELAQQVLNCEIKLRPASTAFQAELAVVGLNKTNGKSFQNQNMWLANTSGQLTLQGDFIALGIPALTLEDGPGGIIYRPPARDPQPTNFPNELALGASMDPPLAKSFGVQLGLEANQMHYMGVQAPDLNLDRIPNWGRIAETFGEDPVLSGEMGAQESIGLLQNTHVVVLKHFGLYGQETNRKTVNDVLTSSRAMYDTFVRPFDIAASAVAASPQVAKDRQVAMMCSYGKVNWSLACTNPIVDSALSHVPFSGLVRSDLDTLTPVHQLLNSGVQLVKPLVVNSFEPFSTVTPAVKANVTSAALKVLSFMFSADLVSSNELAIASKVGLLSPSTHNAGITLANYIESRGAVLLKNTSLATAGSLPVTTSEHHVVIVAPVDLYRTCKNLAISLAQARHIAANCATWNAHFVAPQQLFGALSNIAGGRALSATRNWIAPTSGHYLVETDSFGDTTLSLNGNLLQSQPGRQEFKSGYYSTINVVAGHSYSFKVSWTAVAPNVTVTPLASYESAARAAVSGASMAIVLVHDYAAEGMDRYQLGLPLGQDQIVSAVASVVPTSVGILSSGPILMPWLSQVDSAIELWNPVGVLPIDTVTSTLVPAYTALFDGQTSPSGHLPVTFPADQDLSPMSLGTGTNRYAYWPGTGGNANLNLAPLSGTEIGYGWYHALGWPILFPFGYGLTYSTMTTSFDLSGSCVSATSNSICLPVAVRLTNDVARPARASVQVYVSQPSTPLNPRPTLVLGDVSLVTCRDGNGLTGACANGVDTTSTITALNVGAWNNTSSSYQFLPGCYSFVVAANANDAYNQLANATTSSTMAVHAIAPFSFVTTLAPGACPAG